MNHSVPVRGEHHAHPAIQRSATAGKELKAEIARLTIGELQGPTAEMTGFIIGTRASPAKVSGKGRAAADHRGSSHANDGILVSRAAADRLECRRVGNTDATEKWIEVPVPRGGNHEGGL